MSSFISKWKKIKRSGTFNRKLKSNYNNIINYQRESINSYNNQKKTVVVSDEISNNNIYITTPNTLETDEIISDSGVPQAAISLEDAERVAEIDNWIEETTQFIIGYVYPVPFRARKLTREQL